MVTIHLALEDMVLHCGMKMVLPHILKQLRGQNSCIVFLLFYLSHTIKMSVYLMHIRRVVFNCLVIGWTMGQAVILLKLLLIERHWNEIVIGERKIWRLFFLVQFFLNWLKKNTRGCLVPSNGGKAVVIIFS